MKQVFYFVLRSIIRLLLLGKILFFFDMQLLCGNKNKGHLTL